MPRRGSPLEDINKVEQGASNAPSILFVEDDRAILGIYKDVWDEDLPHDNLKAGFAASINEAIEYIKNNNVIFAVLDCRLPGNDEGWFEIAKKIKESNVPCAIVICTANPDGSRRKLKINEVLAGSNIKKTDDTNGIMEIRKPFNLDDLIAITQAQIGRMLEAYKEYKANPKE